LYCRRLLATAVLLAPVAGAAALLGFGLQPDDGLFAFWGTPSMTASAITVLVAVTARGIATEIQEFLAQAKHLKRMDYFSNMWNVLDVASLSLNIVVVICVLARVTPTTTSQIAAVNTVLLVMESIQLLAGFDSTAKYVAMFFEVTKDMVYFLLMIGEPGATQPHCTYVYLQVEFV
jgi:hypothetical protein